MTTRRKILTIIAGAAALPAVGARASNDLKQWRGIALGANAHIILEHPDADRLINNAVDEIHRLEKIFSLYQADSQISRLNNEGVLHEPAFEMIELLSLCSRLNERTKGAFDPTVQALWSLYAESFSAGRYPTEKRIHQALSVTGWNHVEFSTQQVSFDRAGVMLTLNGIAQGYIADKVKKLLSDNGVTSALVNAGEIATLGGGPKGDGWQVELRNSQDQNIPLHNRSIATSALLGTTFNANGTVGHILDPRTGYAGGVWSEVSVVSNSSAEADGLSTAFCLMPAAEISACKGDSEVYLS